MTDTCTHERFQCVVTSVSTFPGEWEDDDVVLIVDSTIEYSIASVEIICEDCGEQRHLTEDEWEIA